MFPTYEKIAESPDRWRLEETAYRRLRGAEWVVTEKVHGANFCLGVEGDIVRCANRREWLAEGDPFFGWQTVRDRLKAPVQELFARLCAERGEIRRLLVYGELFGGGYPHPEVPPVAGVQPVQTGVWYAPDIRFCAFDIRVETVGGETRYLDYARAQELLTDVQILCVAPLFVGRYEAAMEYDVRFDSTLPRRLGLPALPAGSNPAEGIVIKPWRELGLQDRTGAPVRPVLKRKIPEFAEDRRFHEAEKWTAPAGGAVAGTLPLDLLKWEAYNRITPNRRDAVLSKIGPDAPGSQARLFVLLVQEVLEEAREATPDAWAALAAGPRAELRTYVEGELRTLLRGSPRPPRGLRRG